MLATSLGLESPTSCARRLASIAQSIRGQAAQLKRALLDKLDTLHRFEAPPTLAEEEFKNV
jgi:FKBP-type peptidyl-prolyl cis-trans isomerase (trigger factor)